MAIRSETAQRSPTHELVWFALLVTLLASIFYVVGPLLGSLSAVTKSNVPAAALMFVCPSIAAMVLARRCGSHRQLVATFRLPTVRWQVWVTAALVLPATVFCASILSGEYRFTAPTAMSSFLLAVIYLVASLGEEIGWTGYALPRLMRLHGEFASALILGGFWAAWHIIPFWEAGNGAAWIVGQCLFSVVLRVILVRLTVIARMSIWPAVVCHATYNLAWSLSPESGAHYNPWIAGIVCACAAAFLYLIRRASPGTQSTSAATIARPARSEP